MLMNSNDDTHRMRIFLAQNWHTTEVAMEALIWFAFGSWILVSLTAVVAWASLALRQQPAASTTKSCQTNP